MATLEYRHNQVAFALSRNIATSLQKFLQQQPTQKPWMDAILEQCASVLGTGTNTTTTTGAKAGATPITRTSKRNVRQKAAAAA